MQGQATDIAALVDRAIGREGKYVDNPADRGGATRWGIAEALDDTLTAAASRSAGGDNVFYIGDTRDNPLRLAQIMRAADHGDPLAYFELAEQIEERDLHYVGVLATRKRSVCQVDVSVDAASDDARDVAMADIHRAAIVETGAPATLLAWSMARSKVRTGASDVARIAFVGDSKTMGAGAGTAGTGYTAGAYAKSRPMRVAAQLAAAGYNVRGDTWFGAAGLGSVADVLLYDPRRSGFNGWGGGNNSLGGGMLAAPNANPAVFQPSVATDRCSVFYRNGADRPSFTVAKGSESFTITPTGPAGGLARGEIVFATRDTGAISVARSGNSGGLHLAGMVAWDSTKPGIEIANLGVFGVTSGFYTDTTQALSQLNALGLYAPHLTVINLGTNDIAQNVPQATWLANLRTIVAVAKATGSVLLTWPSVGGAANSFGQDQTRLLWSAALRALASELGCAFVNEEALLGGRTAAQANGAFRDGIHEVDWAYDMEAAAIRQAIA